MFDALIKVGGSLYQHPGLRASAAAWARLAARHRLLVLPGGGPFADQVRAAGAQVGLSDEAAHWMAILAIDQYGYLLADLAPRAAVTHDLNAAAAVCAAGRLAVLAPSTLLLQVDPLPHSWQVTADSIAAWLAGYVGCQRLALLKSIAGVYRAAPQEDSPALLEAISRRELAGQDVVDPYFVEALPAECECWLIDGRQPQRLQELLERGRTVGTRVVGS